MTSLALNQSILRVHSLSDDLTIGLRQEAFLELKKHVEFDSGVWAGGTHNPHRLHTSYLHLQPKSLLMLYESEFLFKQDFVRAAAIACPGKAVRLSELMPREKFESMLVYKLLCKPLGIQHSMAITVINTVTGLSDFIALWRKDVSKPFSTEDAALLELMSPHLFLADQRWLNRNIQLEVPSEKVGSRALMDSNGCLYVADSRVGEHFRASWPNWTGPIVPDVVLQASRMARDLDAAQVFITADHRRYEVKAYQCPLMGAAFKLSILHEKELSDLSPRESEVAKLYAKGMTYKQIARALGTAPATVRNQCMTALRKLGLRNKTELANRLVGG